MDKLQIYAAQLGLSTITATIASKCGLLGWMLVAVAAAMVIDFLAGMAYCKCQGSSGTPG